MSRNISDPAFRLPFDPVPLVSLTEKQAARISILEMEKTGLKQLLGMAEAANAEHRARIAELERREAVLTRLMHATRDLDICGIRGAKGRCQGCDAHYVNAVAAVIDEWPALQNGWVRALTDAGFPWPTKPSEGSPEDDPDDVSCVICGAPVLIEGLTLCGPCNTGEGQ